MKKFLIGFMVFVLVLFIVPAVGYAWVTFPSTNELNKTQQVPGRIGQAAPYVNLVDVGVGYVTLDFVNKHTNSLAYFEVRIDGEVKTSGTTHPNPFVTDFIYPGVSVDTRGTSLPLTVTRTFNANEYIEVRLALGGERDWDFDWTRFDVLPIPDTTAPDVEVTAPTTYLVSGIVEIRGSIVDDNPHHYWLVVVNSEGSKVAGPGTVNETNSLVDASLWVWDTTLVPDGIYTIKLEARDVAGNKDSGSVDWLVVEVDNVTTKAEVLIRSGVPGKGLENAPGLDKPFNPKSQAGENAGQK